MLWLVPVLLLLLPTLWYSKGSGNRALTKVRDLGQTYTLLGDADNLRLIGRSLMRLRPDGELVIERRGKRYVDYSQPSAWMSWAADRCEAARVAVPAAIDAIHPDWEEAVEALTERIADVRITMRHRHRLSGRMVVTIEGVDAEGEPLTALTVEEGWLYDNYGGRRRSNYAHRDFDTRDRFVLTSASIAGSTLDFLQDKPTEAEALAIQQTLDLADPTLTGFFEWVTTRPLRLKTTARDRRLRERREQQVMLLPQLAEQAARIEGHAVIDALDDEARGAYRRHLEEQAASLDQALAELDRLDGTNTPAALPAAEADHEGRIRRTQTG